MPDRLEGGAGKMGALAFVEMLSGAHTVAVTMASAAKLLPDERDPGFVYVVAGLFAMALLGAANHFFAVREHRTRVKVLDAFFSWIRARLVRDYLKGKNQFGVQLLVAATFGLWGVSALLLMLAAGDLDWLGWIAVALWAAGLAPLPIFRRRTRSRIPQDRKPTYLIEAERAAGSRPIL